MSDKTYIGYSPVNFYYVDALYRGASYAPNDAACTHWLEGNVDLSCSFTEPNPDTNNIWFVDNSFNCIQKELCINKELAQSLALENSNNGGQERYFDNNHAYYNYVLKIANLGVGICVILYLMLFRKKMSASKQI